MREIRTLRARRRGLETELRQAGLRRGFERDRESHRKPVATAPVLDPTGAPSVAGTLPASRRETEQQFVWTF